MFFNKILVLPKFSTFLLNSIFKPGKLCLRFVSNDHNYFDLMLNV